MCWYLKQASVRILLCKSREQAAAVRHALESLYESGFLGATQHLRDAAEHANAGRHAEARLSDAVGEILSGKRYKKNMHEEPESLSFPDAVILNDGGVTSPQGNLVQTNYVDLSGTLPTGGVTLAKVSEPQYDLAHDRGPCAYHAQVCSGRRVRSS